MAKVDFGEFSAFTTTGGIRFQKNNKLISETAIPPEVAAFLRKKIEEAQVEDAKVPSDPDQLPELTPEDFGVEPVTDEQIEAVASQIPREIVDAKDIKMEDMAPTSQLHILHGTDISEPQDEPTPAEVPHDPLPGEFIPGNHTPVQPSETLEPEPVTREVIDTDFIEGISIHTASIEDIAHALNERFGIYTVYLGRMPATDEVDPLTGEYFTKYSQGVAYQAAIRARSNGVLTRNPEDKKKAIDAGRDASNNRTMDAPPATMGEARRQDSFAYRTSVRGNRKQNPDELVAVERNGEMHTERQDTSLNGAHSVIHPDEEEPLVQMPQRGKKVIRPNW